MTPDEIRSIRHALGWTQARFAKRLGVITRAVQFWEAGDRSPSGPALIQLKRLRRKIQRRESGENKWPLS